MTRCPALTAKGDQCSAQLRPGQEWCYGHDPARAAERRAHASKAAKAKGGSELADVKAELRQLFTDVRRGEADPRKAAVAAQVANALLRALALEREIQGQEEIAARIERLEREL